MPRVRREKETSSLIFFLVIVFVTLLDQVTKFLALRYLSDGNSIPVITNVFHLTLVRNKGIAFGFFRSHPQLLFLLITLSLIFLFIWGLRMREGTWVQRFGLALILGGALGTWLYRLRYGAVIDFFDFRVWPVFNVADSAITIGVCLFIILMLRPSK